MRYSIVLKKTLARTVSKLVNKVTLYVKNNKNYIPGNYTLRKSTKKKKWKE